MLDKIAGYISKHNKNLFDQFQKAHNTTISRMVAIAIEHELEREKPFEYPCNPPADEYLEFAYAHHATKIINYLKDTAGLSLEDMMLLRHDIGIPDKAVFMLAFRDALMSNQIESYKPYQPAYAKVKYDDDYLFYRIAGSSKRANKLLRRKATRFEEYQKLKKEFKNE